MERKTLMGCKSPHFYERTGSAFRHQFLQRTTNDEQRSAIAGPLSTGHLKARFTRRAYLRGLRFDTARADEPSTFREVAQFRIVPDRDGHCCTAADLRLTRAVRSGAPSTPQ